MAKIFSGYHNKRDYFLQRFDEQLIRWTLPLIPREINSVQLTLATVALSALNILVGLIARNHYASLLWLLPILGLHHLCDTLDGALGRARKEGWVLWGYFMDKFVDFVYVGSLSAAFILILPSDAFFSLMLFVGYGGLMVASYLEFGVTKKSLIRSRHGLGPTEAKFILGLLLILASTTGPKMLSLLVEVGSITLLVYLCLTVFSIQKKLAAMDRKNKNRKTKTERLVRSPQIGRKAKV